MGKQVPIRWCWVCQGGVKGGNWKGGNWDFVDFVDLVNLFNSAEMYKNIRGIKKPTTGALCAPVGRGRRPRLWLLFPLILSIFSMFS